MRIYIIIVGTRSHIIKDTSTVMCNPLSKEESVLICEKVYIVYVCTYMYIAHTYMYMYMYMYITSE